MFLFITQTFPLHAQCPYKGGCSPMEVIQPPALEVSMGYTTTNIVTIDLNYVFKCGLVLGSSGGIRPYNSMTGSPEDRTINGMIGYNLGGCAIIGFTFGSVHFSNYFKETFYDGSESKIIRVNSTKRSYGMMIKLITMYAPFPITVGAFANDANMMGVSVGTVIEFKKKRKF